MRAGWGVDLVLTPRSFPWNKKPTLCSRHIRLTVVFSGCGGKIPQIIGVSGVEYGPVSGPEPRQQLDVQL